MKGIAIIAGAICLEKAEKAEEERKKKNKITSSALIICQKRVRPAGLQEEGQGQVPR